MKQNIKTSGIVFILPMLVLISIIALWSLSNSPESAFGSVVVGNDYSSKEITSTNASNTAPTIVKVGTGSLGSIVIASSTTGGGYFRIYDHTSSTSSATSTRIASFPAGAAGGTYTFDRDILKGIVLEVPAGFNGSYVVTYR